MSISRMATIAAQRDSSVPVRTKKKPKDAAEAAETEQRGYIDLLVSAIPTEPLALYTFLIAGIVATIDVGENQRLTLRWAIYGVMIAFIVLWLTTSYLRLPKADRKRRLPWLEIATAVIAFGAWGLVMPESPLFAELSGDDRVISTLIITAAGAAIVSLLTGSLKKPAPRN
jgi:hypothetical protein